MLGRVAILVAITAAGMISAGPAKAWRWRQHTINATPFSHSPCSVLRGRPCTPSFCSVLNHGPCIPEIEYPYGENLQLTIETVPPDDEKEKYVQSPTTISTASAISSRNCAPAGRLRRRTARRRACR